MGHMPKKSFIVIESEGGGQRHLPQKCNIQMAAEIEISVR